MNIINDYFNKNEKIYFPFQKIKLLRRTKSIKDIIKKNFSAIQKYNDTLSNSRKKQNHVKTKIIFNDKSYLEEKRKLYFPNIFQNKISLNQKLMNSLSFNAYGYEDLQNLSLKNISLPLFSSIIKKGNEKEKEKNKNVFFEKKFKLLNNNDKKKYYNINNKSSDFLMNKSSKEIKENMLI